MPDLIHHSTLQDKSSVAQAGESAMDAGGKIDQITNASGHFRPAVNPAAREKQGELFAGQF